MRRVLFELGPIKIHSYGAMLVVAFFAGIMLGRRRAERFGLKPDQVYDASFWALILGILGARVLYMVQEWKYYAANPHEILSLQFEGLTSFGGLLGGFLGLWIWSKLAKKPLLSILDLASACFLLAHPIGRIGCLLNGCCYGHACDLPWGVTVEGLPGQYHPAQVYDALLNLVALAILLLMERRGLRPGQSLGAFFVLHGLTRVIYEFWRAGTSSTTISGLPITEAQVAAGLLMVAGAILFVVRGRAPRRDS
jgi:phosphatidylglycerol:prolipoprotein diacylglycerol transferase